MGRVKTQLIKRTTRKLLDTNGEKFTANFDENKKVVQELLNFPNKKLRNVIAGYATRLTRNKEEI